MKNNAKKATKKAPRFGVLDAVIILLIIVAVVGVYFRYNIIDFISNMRNLENYTVSYSVENVRHTINNYVNIDDEVYFADDGELFGTLINSGENNVEPMRAMPASQYFTKSNGEIVSITYPDNEQSRVDITGRLVCIGNYTEDGGFLVNGKTYIAAGQYINVQTEYVTFTIRIEEIALYEDN